MFKAINRLWQVELDRQIQQHGKIKGVWRFIDLYSPINFSFIALSILAIIGLRSIILLVISHTYIATVIALGIYVLLKRRITIERSFPLDIDKEIENVDMQQLFADMGDSGFSEVSENE